MLKESRVALRRLARHPLWLAGAILALALGIGANAAVFTVLRAVLLRPLPFPDSERLALIWEERPEKEWAFAPVAPADFLDWRSTAQSFSGMTAYSVEPLESALTGRAEPRLVRHLPVFGDFFSVLGIPFAQGHGFGASDSLSPQSAVAVVSERLWSQLGSRAHLDDRITLGGVSYRVVGVVQGDLAFPTPGIDVWTPVYWPAATRSAPFFRQAHNLRVLGRLREGVSWRVAQTELLALAARLEKSFPESNRRLTAGLMPLRNWVAKDVQLSLLILWATSGLAFLLACVNVANLQLMRGLAASRDLATRQALGATAGTLLRQSFLESALVALLGGGIGWGLGAAATAGFLRLFPGELPRAAEIRVDAPVALFVFVLGLLATVLTGTLAAGVPSQRRLAETLQEGGAATPGAGRARALKGLLALEAALAGCLLLSACLLLRSFEALRKVDLGFVPDRVLTTGLALPWDRYRTSEQKVGAYRELLRRVEALPGVRRAAFADAAPLTGLRWTGSLEKDSTGAGTSPCEFHHRVVSPGYFQALGVPLLQGAGFSPGPLPAGGEVVINQVLAAQCFGAGSPLGRRVRFLREGIQESGWLTVSGVTGPERIESVAEAPRPELFEPVDQAPPSSLYLLVSSSLVPGPLYRQLKETVQSLDPDLPLAAPLTLEEIVGRATTQPRLLLILIGSLALLATSLAGVGVFSVTAYAVAQRRREIGIRLAIGAPPRQVHRLIARAAVGAVGLGAGVGLLLAGLLARAARSLLFGIAPTDAPAILLAVAGLTVGLLFPAYFAARRALAISPTLPLRAD